MLQMVNSEELTTLGLMEELQPVVPLMSIASNRELCYNDAMRSQEESALRMQFTALDVQKMIEWTKSQNRHASDELQPAPYFIISPGVARQVGNKIVTAYVHLDNHGRRSEGVPRMYAIVERPTNPVVEHAAIRLREAHVLAEDRALQLGLWTPAGRSEAELLVAEKVAEPSNARTYIPDRVAHLGALAAEIDTERNFHAMTPQIVGELNRGIDTLADFYQRVTGEELPV